VTLVVVEKDAVASIVVVVTALFPLAAIEVLQ